MYQIVIGFALVTLVGAWISLLTAAAFWIYSALGTLRCGIVGGVVGIAFVGFVFWREILQERKAGQGGTK